MSVCNNSVHPGIVYASRNDIAAHPERRTGQTMYGQWVGSMIGALACCAEAVCESVERTANHDCPALHHPDVTCRSHLRERDQR